MRFIYNVKHCSAIRLEFGGKFLISRPSYCSKRSSICSTIRQNLLLNDRTFLAFVVVVIIIHIFVSLNHKERPIVIDTTNFSVCH